MNSKQAVALAVGTVLAVILVLMPRSHTHLQRVSQRQGNGEIVTTYQSHPSYLQPALFALVVLGTGACVFTLRHKM